MARTQSGIVKTGASSTAFACSSTLSVPLLSAEPPEPALQALRAERERHGAVLLVDAPETPWIIKSAPRYSHGPRRGRSQAAPDAGWWHA